MMDVFWYTFLANLAVNCCGRECMDIPLSVIFVGIGVSQAMRTCVLCICSTISLNVLLQELARCIRTSSSSKNSQRT